MKLLNLTQFRELPEGVVFMKYEPQIFGELSVKDETWDCDFLSGELAAEVKCSGSDEMFNILDVAENDSSYSIKLDLDVVGRDGCFEDRQLFAVYEQIDIDNLINKLKTCKGLK